MGDWINYQGRPLGRIRVNDNGTNNLVFIAENIESLTTLFRLNLNDVVRTETQGEIHYRKFQEETLPKISGFYPSLDAWAYRDTQASSS